MSESEQVYGIHAVQHAFRNAPDRVLEMWIQQDSQNPAVQAIIKLARENGVSVQFAPRKTLDKMSEGARHQGVVIRQRPTKMLAEADLERLVQAAEKPVLLLILDGVQDPHNLGACMRTADAAGVDAIVIPHSRGVGITPVVRKVACGAADSVPLIAVSNLARTLKALQKAGVWLIGTSDQAEKPIYEHDLTGPIGLVMGAEGAGIRRLTREGCDFLARLPMAGVVESLNVSVATGVCLYEAVRQRNV